MIIENEENVLKWFKPAKGDFPIHYSHEESYEPDFVVETKTTKYLCEPKAGKRNDGYGRLGKGRRSSDVVQTCDSPRQ